MTKKAKSSQKIKDWLIDLGEHIAGSFNWSKLLFIVILFAVSTVGYLFIKNNQ